MSSLHDYLATIEPQSSSGFFELLNTLTPILIIPIGVTACYLLKPTETVAILKDARYSRILHYQLMIFLGIALAITSTSSEFNAFINTPLQLLHDIILSMISLFFAALFSIIFNNLSDISIDTISNRQRPLITQTISPSLYTKLGVAFFLISIGYAYLVDYKVVLLLSGCMANYWIYSMPPYRFKRIPILSKIILSINSIFMIVLGYYLVRNEITGIPNMIYFIFLICFTLAANVIDLKDTEGDLAAGIYTLPAIIGSQYAKMAIGFAALFNSLAYYFLFNTTFSLVALSLNGLFLYYLINKKQYDEQPVLIATNLGMSLLISYLCVTTL